ncbi:MAG: metallohydrolase [Gammaproteobacteria bacterium]
MASVSYFPVDNGDMTLLELESGKKILIDINIREAADLADGAAPDVAEMLRERLNRDPISGDYYVDVFLLSHPDEDHCRGLARHFHLGSPDTHPGGDKILIREMWSSPMVLRRASKNHTLCSDAKAWNAEARRRVKEFRAGNGDTRGNRILVLGEDEDGKTDDLTRILVKTDQQFWTIDGTGDPSFSARLLAPFPKAGDDEEILLSKNNSSVVLQFELAAEGNADACHYLTGGDAGVAVWERLWARHKDHPHWLDYDLLLVPHHCSWRSLSHQSWSEHGEHAEVSNPAKSALSQTRVGAYLVSSSKEIKDDDNDPPCIRAKREYVAIANEARGRFTRVAGTQPSKYLITRNGPRLETASATIGASVSAGIIGCQPLPHG